MSGVKGRSGPRKSPNTIVNQALARCDKDFPAIFQVVIDRALKGDVNSAIYLIDRRLGKPRQSIDQRVAAVIVTPDDYELATRLTKATEAKVLQDYSVTLLEEGEDGQDSQGENEALP